MNTRRGRAVQGDFLYGTFTLERSPWLVRIKNTQARAWPWGWGGVGEGRSAVDCCWKYTLSRRPSTVEFEGECPYP